MDERQSIVVGKDGMTTGYGFRHSTDAAGRKTRARTSFELVEGLGIVEEVGHAGGEA